jgi:hypothetical protein
VPGFLRSMKPNGNNGRKPRHARLAISLLVTIAAVPDVLPQGTILFNNRAAGVDAPIFVYTDRGAIRAEGSKYVAQLYAGPNLSALAPVGSPAPFRTGADAGYWDPAPDATRVVPTVTPGEFAFVRVVGWDTSLASSYEEYRTLGSLGESSIFTLLTSKTGVPVPLVYLQSFTIGIPEPSAHILFACGLLGLLGWMRAANKS